jgi:enoyl-CoA hydratase/carnithine racemase
MYETISIEKQNHVATLTLNRPDRLNAVNLQMKRELRQALEELEADDDVKVVIMTGAGRAFSVGHDMTDPISNMDECTNLEEEEKLFNFNKPIIAAINGYALGDGIQQALLCDIILASDNAIVGFIGPMVGGLCNVAMWALRDTVGWRKASELLLTCDQISANEAHRIGLVNKVVPPEQLMPAALEMAEKVMKAAPLAIKYTKEALRQGLLDTDIKASVREVVRVTNASEDMKEAARAFQEKREPVFKGK